MTNLFFLYIYYILENINKIFSSYIYFPVKKYYYHHNNMIKNMMFFRQYLNIYFFYQIKTFLFSKSNIFVLVSPPIILFKKNRKSHWITPITSSNSALVLPTHFLANSLYISSSFVKTNMV